MIIYLNYINLNNTSNYEQDNLSRRTRSFSSSFDFRSNCFLCGRSISEREKRNGSNIVFVLCEYQKEENVTVVILCLFCANIERWTYQFHDDWATEVSGRFGLINDLRAEDAIYHKRCNSNFRTLKGKPTSKPFGIKNPTHPERGRPSNATQEAVFNEVVKYLQENDDEQITISELTEMMGKLCVDLKIAYSKVWMKQKLLDRFGDDIMIGNINGKEDVVTFIFNAKKILAEFCETIDPSSENTEEQKQRIM